MLASKNEMRMDTNKILNKFKVKLLENTENNQIEYADAVNALKEILEELERELYLKEDRKYDLWGQEVGLKKDII